MACVMPKIYMKGMKTMKNYTTTSTDSIWEDINSPWEKKTAETSQKEKDIIIDESPAHIRKKKPRILWGRVFIASLLLGLIVYCTSMCFMNLTQKIPTETLSSIDTASVQDESAPYTTSSISENKANVEKQMLVSLSDEEFATLVLAVQHECGREWTLYLTIEERSLLANSTSEAEIEKIEAIARERLNRCQQLTAATMLNRIGKPGFSDTLNGVLTQEGQYSRKETRPLVDEYGNIFGYEEITIESLLDDIGKYWDNPNASQFDPCDQQTINNIKEVLYGKTDISENLVYEISGHFASFEEANENLKSRCSPSKWIYVTETIPCSYYYEDEDGNWVLCDFWAVFGVNDTGTGYPEPI